MLEVKPFRLGVVEGFFGKSWPWDARTRYSRFLSGNGFTTYLYAPKNDPYFRKKWTEPCPHLHRDALIQLAGHYRGAGIEFAIGLSPYELYLEFTPARQDALAAKLEEIDAINPDTLCILFDDMRGTINDLAPRQLRIMEFVTRNSKARNYIFCPTYYSDDPALDTHFGRRPAGYLEELGRQLDSRIDIFWTGPKVISAEIPDDHLIDVAERLHRKPLLWDNYPVNDSKQLTGYLRIKPFEHRGPGLKSLAQGHMANPMNEAWLSQIPLYTLGRLYQDTGLTREELFFEACHALCPQKLADLIYEDADVFQETGLEALSDEEKAGLVYRYTPFQEHPMAGDIIAWIRGDFAFDPACLT